MSNKKVIGYTTGVFDLFHIGHLNIIKMAKSECDYLIVGVTTDEVAIEMKGNAPVIPFDERLEIVNSIKYVDRAVAKSSTNNLLAWEDLSFDVFFKGDDWKGTVKGFALEKAFAHKGVRIHYFPYTRHVSSSVIRTMINKDTFKP